MNLNFEVHTIIKVHFRHSNREIPLQSLQKAVKAQSLSALLPGVIPMMRLSETLYICDDLCDHFSIEISSVRADYHLILR